MAWSSVSTTMAMIGFLGVVGAGVYVLAPTESEHRVERMCKPIRTGSDLAYEYIGNMKPGIRDEAVLYPKGVEKAHTDICSAKVAKWMFGETASSIYLAKDAFRQKLIAEIKLERDVVEHIVNVGEESNINWLDERESAALLAEYVDYLNYRRTQID